MLKCVTILNVLLLAVGTDAFGQIKARHLMCQRTQGIWDYVVMDVTTYPPWNGATVALLADVINHPQNTAAPTSGLLPTQECSMSATGRRAGKTQIVSPV